jgi:hypothetical protein
VDVTIFYTVFERSVVLSRGQCYRHAAPLQIQYLEEGARVHQTEMQWQRIKLARQHEREVAALRSRHEMNENDNKLEMDSLVYDPQAPSRCVELV